MHLLRCTHMCPRGAALGEWCPSSGLGRSRPDSSRPFPVYYVILSYTDRRVDRGGVTPARCTMPLWSATAISVLVLALGDVLAQWLTRARRESGYVAHVTHSEPAAAATSATQPLDLWRVARAGTWGAILSPLAFLWFSWLDGAVTAAGVPGLLLKLLLDQLVWSPPITVRVHAAIDVSRSPPA